MKELQEVLNEAPSTSVSLSFDSTQARSMGRIGAPFEIFFLLAIHVKVFIKLLLQART